MRNTKQKDLILDIINTSTNHLTADEVYQIARETISNISLGTVYRILNQMVYYGFIRQIYTEDGVSHYDSTLIAHNHFICNNCHKIYDVTDNTELKDVTCGKITSYEILYRGICSDCLKKEE
jgi:Fur family transcriptional regulator, peroxide stress response regulator